MFLFTSFHLEMPPGQVSLNFLLVPIIILSQTGADAETLKKVEARIQAQFVNGIPPHLLPSAKSLTYTPGSNQSKIFVASHSEFSKLHARDIQGILRDRLILVHGNVFDYSYGWDLESFGQLHDVDKKVSVLGEINCPIFATCSNAD
jgi:hypothetical protein